MRNLCWFLARIGQDVISKNFIFYRHKVTIENEEHAFRLFHLNTRDYRYSDVG